MAFGNFTLIILLYIFIWWIGKNLLFLLLYFELDLWPFILGFDFLFDFLLLLLYLFLTFDVDLAFEEKLFDVFWVVEEVI